MSGNDSARSFLDSLVGYTADAQGDGAGKSQQVKLGVVDPAYTSGAARVKFDGETVMGTRTYVALQSVAANDRVVLLPVGRTYVILGSVGATAGSNLPVGTSLDGHWAAAPSGFLLEDGAVLTRASYPALFAVLSTRYNTGGETVAQFRLPDSRGRVAVPKSVDVEFDVLGEKGGEKAHTLTTAELPANIYPTSLSVPVTAAAGSTLRFVDGNVTGGGASHNNLQPYMVITRVIKY